MSKLVQIYCQNTDIALSLISQFLLCNPPSYFEELNQIHNRSITFDNKRGKNDKRAIDI